LFFKKKSIKEIATNIEVKLESGGLTSITVFDNGIEEKDRNAMRLKTLYI